MSEGTAVAGLAPVRELLVARPDGVRVVYLAAGDRSPGLRDLRDLCRERGVRVEEAPPGRLQALAGGARHQGAVALTAGFAYADLEDLLEAAEARAEKPLLVVLDSVQDPHNLGAVLRSAAAFGAHGVVIGKDRAAAVTPTVVKVSAGAAAHVPVARVVNVARAIEDLKKRGVWTVAAVPGDAPPPWALDLRDPVALALGAEGPGLRPLVERTCDLRVSIPMAGPVGSLNVSVAAAVLLYEAFRQRRFPPGTVVPVRPSG
ncbi:MAG: 23S rRNA (guanosine(2251)-2'-O)-methyltransferase RlmB [Planctomycetales bacterium]|nr:23S rRNA (guanosine(2251)-2'-O)-methyltransferase RlmB [Planctomycetales bacterium]